MVRDIKVCLPGYINLGQVRSAPDAVTELPGLGDVTNLRVSGPHAFMFDFKPVTEVGERLERCIRSGRATFETVFPHTFKRGDTLPKFALRISFDPLAADEDKKIISEFI